MSRTVNTLFGAYKTNNALIEDRKFNIYIYNPLLYVYLIIDIWNTTRIKFVFINQKLKAKETWNEILLSYLISLEACGKGLIKQVDTRLQVLSAVAAKTTPLKLVFLNNIDKSNIQNERT